MFQYQNRKLIKQKRHLVFTSTKCGPILYGMKVLAKIHYSSLTYRGTLLTVTMVIW